MVREKQAHLPSPATVIASLALAIAVANSGAAHAAASSVRAMITGQSIKDGSVTGKDLRNNSVTGSDLKNGSVSGLDVRDGSLSAADISDKSLTGRDVADGSLTGADVRNGSLHLSDLGGARSAMEAVVASEMPIAAGQCQGTLTGNFGDDVIGDLVVATITDAAGDAVLPNTAAVVPTVVVSSSQGGAVPNLLVCNSGAVALTVPAGAVFHYRLIDR